MKTHCPSSVRLAIACAALSLANAAWSQSTKPSNCDSRQDPAACAREQGAAKQEAARGGLTQPGAGSRDDAARCEALPPAERSDCEARMRGNGPGQSSSSGSVMGGGIIRETVTPAPAPPAR